MQSSLTKRIAQPQEAVLQSYQEQAAVLQSYQKIQKHKNQLPKKYNNRNSNGKHIQKCKARQLTSRSVQRLLKEQMSLDHLQPFPKRRRQKRNQTSSRKERRANQKTAFSRSTRQHKETKR